VVIGKTRVQTELADLLHAFAATGSTRLPDRASGRRVERDPALRLLRPRHRTGRLRRLQAGEPRGRGRGHRRRRLGISRAAPALVRARRV